MKVFALVLSVAAMASAGSLGSYMNAQGGSGGSGAGALQSAIFGQAPAATSFGGNQGGQSGGYGQQQPQPSGGYGQQTQKQCRTVYDDVPKEHCESYTDRICRTTQKESCSQGSGQNCRGVISASGTRQCFNVTETRCMLKEDVKFETVDVPFVVQKCTKVPERVCDTLHDAQVSDKEEMQCINIDRDVCQTEEQNINDRTCKTTINFDCSVGKSYPQSAPAPTGGSNDGYGNNGGASGSGYGGNSGMGSSAGGYGGNNGDSSSMNAYGQPQVNCKRTPETQCYDIPRSVSNTRCQRKTEQQCERLRSGAPVVTPQQACHNEEKKVCQLEHRQQPKQVKKYEYTKQCEQVPRMICETIDSQKLVPSCVPTSHTTCTYSPVEQCEDIPKQHCFQYTVQVARQECTETPATGGYGQQQQQAAPMQQQQTGGYGQQGHGGQQQQAAPQQAAPMKQGY
jgi:hypothetical protein